MYIYICTYIYICIHICIYIHMYVYMTCVFMPSSTYGHMYTRTRIRTNTYIVPYTSGCNSTYIYNIIVYTSGVCCASRSWDSSGNAWAPYRLPRATADSAQSVQLHCAWWGWSYDWYGLWTSGVCLCVVCVCLSVSVSIFVSCVGVPVCMHLCVCLSVYLSVYCVCLWCGRVFLESVPVCMCHVCISASVSVSVSVSVSAWPLGPSINPRVRRLPIF